MKTPVEDTPLVSLIQSRLNAIDSKRERAERPAIFVYFGAKTSGEIAVPPKLGINTRRMRVGDQLPEGAVFWEYSWQGVQQRFERMTNRTGVNVWRWK